MQTITLDILAHLAYEFLQVEPHVIQHFGIKRGTLKYGDDGEGILNRLAGMPSPYRGKFANKWPIHVDPDDVSRVYIKDPDTRRWHTLLWEHHTKFPMPFSDEALQFTRQIVRRRDGVVDDQVALDELLTRWNIRLGDSPASRRIALRMARHDADLSNQGDDADVVAALTSMAHLQAPEGGGGAPQFGPEPSDDDDDDDIESDFLDDDLEWA